MTHVIAFCAFFIRNSSVRQRNALLICGVGLASGTEGPGYPGKPLGLNVCSTSIGRSSTDVHFDSSSLYLFHLTGVRSSAVKRPICAVVCQSSPNSVLLFIFDSSAKSAFSTALNVSHPCARQKLAYRCQQPTHLSKAVETVQRTQAGTPEKVFFNAMTIPRLWVAQDHCR